MLLSLAFIHVCSHSFLFHITLFSSIFNLLPYVLYVQQLLASRDNDSTDPPKSHQVYLSDIENNNKREFLKQKRIAEGIPEGDEDEEENEADSIEPAHTRSPFFPMRKNFSSATVSSVTTSPGKMKLPGNARVCDAAEPDEHSVVTNPTLK